MMKCEKKKKKDKEEQINSKYIISNNINEKKNEKY